MVVLYPLAFYRRSKRPSKSRVVASRQSDHDAASANVGNECCPNCCLPAAKPFVSRYLHGCVVEQHWLCKTCEFTCCLKDGSAWYIELTWPDGRVEHIDSFQSASEIGDWISRKSDAWLKARGK